MDSGSITVKKIYIRHKYTTKCNILRLGLLCLIHYTSFTFHKNTSSPRNATGSSNQMHRKSPVPKLWLPAVWLGVLLAGFDGAYARFSAKPPLCAGDGAKLACFDLLRQTKHPQADERPDGGRGGVTPISRQAFKLTIHALAEPGPCRSSALPLCPWRACRPMAAFGIDPKKPLRRTPPHAPTGIGSLMPRTTG